MRLRRVQLVALVALSASCRTREGAPSSDAAPSPTTTADAALVNVTSLPTASIARLVNPDGLPAYAGPTGSVEGTVTVSGDPAPETPADFKRCPEAARTHGRAFREGDAKAPGGPRWLADAVVAITGYGSFFVPEKEEAETVAIEGCSFTKRTVTMTFGQRLDVKNRTKEFWAPKLEPSPTAVLMMAPPGGDAVKLYPKQPGHYHLVDHDRKYAVEDLYVFLHPLHTSTEVGGTYRIDGVPVGKVTVNTSHPRIGDASASKEVEIRAGVVTRVDLALVYTAPIGQGAEPGGGSTPRLH